MKRFISFIAVALAIVVSSCSNFDDTDIWNKLNDHEKRIVALEELCKQMNTNISSLQSIVNALQKNDYITNVSPVRKDGEEMGYTITFAYGDTITIYHGTNGKDGANGKDGKDGYTPQIGVMKDTDGIYYWTVDGEWLLDGKGNKIQANGVNGTNGSNGQDGTNGKDGNDGADGITPRLKIENGYWYISYDNGATWTELGKATGEDETDGDTIFSSITQDDEYVYFNLADGTMITIAKQRSNNKIYYTTTDDKKLFPSDYSVECFGAILISNVYQDGKGVLIFDDGIDNIGTKSFKSCNRLASIIIPEGVTSIAQAAFYYCTSLTSVTIPDSVTSIAQEAFYNCTSLTNVTIPDSVTSIGSSAFNNCDSLTSVTIPDSVTSIGGGAFYCCDWLTNVIIGNGVTSINDSFNYCSSLTSITIGKGVTSISYDGFRECDHLKTIYCKPTTPPSLYRDGFKYLLSSAKIYVPSESVDIYKSATGWKTHVNQIVGYDFN